MSLFSRSIVVVHSGGMDSSICLAHAISRVGKDQVLSLSFDYGQRHREELECAAEICRHFKVAHEVVAVPCLSALTNNALMDPKQSLPDTDSELSTLVLGRNGLMARLAALRAHQVGAKIIMLGVLQLECANSGYRDCSRAYMDKMQDILRMDLGSDDFFIQTPLIDMTKAQTMAYADQLGVLAYLIEHTVTCYAGLRHPGCQQCAACQLRNAGIAEYQQTQQQLGV